MRSTFQDSRNPGGLLPWASFFSTQRWSEKIPSNPPVGFTACPRGVLGHVVVLMLVQGAANHPRGCHARLLGNGRTPRPLGEIQVRILVAAPLSSAGMVLQETWRRGACIHPHETPRTTYERSQGVRLRYRHAVVTLKHGPGDGTNRPLECALPFVLSQNCASHFGTGSALSERGPAVSAWCA